MNFNLEITMLDLTDTSFPESPWMSQGSFLHACFIFIAAKVERLIGLRELRDLRRQPATTERVVGQLRAVPLDEAERHQKELEQREQKLKDRFQRAMERHLRTPDAIKLGIEVLAGNVGLTEPERWALLHLTVPACSQDLAGYIYGGLDSAHYAGSLTMEALVELSDPQTNDEIFAARNLFKRLVKHGLVTIEHCARQVGPEDVLAAQVQLSWRAFSTLVGRPDLDCGHQVEDENLSETTTS